MPNNYFNLNYNTVDTRKIEVDETTKPLNVVSLFSGAGGMDLGFRGGFEYLGEEYDKNPFNIVFANDIFQQAADVYEANFGHEVERRSIADLDMKKDMPDVDVDIVLGGFPCQTFSYSGKRAGLSDERGQLYLQMIRVIDHYKPKMFIAENVDGIRNSRKNIEGEDVDKSALSVILDDFEKHGYDVQYRVLTAADYGVPQMRRRVIIMGIRKDLGSVDNEFYPQQIFDETGELTGRPWRTSKDGIDDLWDKVNNPNIPNHTLKDISRAKFYPGKKMQGNNRIAENRPAPTIRAEHHGNIEAHYRTTVEDATDMSGWRRLSVRECARLQSFPDSFNFVTSASSAYKAVGNAVPPVMAWHIARSVFFTLKQLEQIEFEKK
ncbi:C-5 cytosine-specific DNA methylase [Amylolactobacillus amylotrophicus DSM 20534]|uniref:DNA (Cytosine-5-)-methyltransferase n=3 Tax=Amylolactobacillus TaxID=2767876 RepID=A0A1L6XCK7_9LACO|nr:MULTISPECIES: DNA cytosine methyltransferase [Amylolactobacillus]APT18703.1 DNA (cytosine-5-)-methyltransferase [Amylolactobacillus amylophilus DSM 20533 = JCM 1125]KRK37725.1 C-5 cytosine-specific DNA methylase [Amylolactobacillus amylotrophicus DSM 20534]KRM41513.1 C-5 cytosine-specific DNA methylase [Amylolactobacillus amylophilus DSM 20533 = JCM 1125]GED80612.1 cytosine-specific methyltransferase [Amylolactobacillus amylophilus]